MAAETVPVSRNTVGYLCDKRKREQVVTYERCFEKDIVVRLTTRNST